MHEYICPDGHVSYHSQRPIICGGCETHGHYAEDMGTDAPRAASAIHPDALTIPVVEVCESRAVAVRIANPPVAAA